MNLLLTNDQATSEEVLEAFGVAASVLEPFGDGVRLLAANTLYREFYRVDRGVAMRPLLEAGFEATSAHVSLLQEKAMQAANEASVVQLEDESHAADGSSRWSRITIYPIIEAAVVKCLLVTIIDVTEMMQTQQQLEDNLTQLVGNHVRVCMSCKQIETEGRWLKIDDYMSTRRDVKFSHGICDSCYATHGDVT